MWTVENRARYDRSRLRYPSDLTDDEWGTHPVRATEAIVDSAQSVCWGGYAAACCRPSRCQFQGSSSSIRLAG